MNERGRLTLALALVIAISSCQHSDLSGPLACIGDPGMVLHPVDTTIAVGSRYVATARAFSGGCPSVDVLGTNVWISQDTVVATVDPGSGEVTGRAPGHTLLIVRLKEQPNFAAAINVTVR